MKKTESTEENYLKESGQALLFVVVALSVALTVGVAISSRTLSSLSRTSSTDSATRVLSAAEGGIEWFLRQPLPVLEALSDGDTNNGNDCPQGTSYNEAFPGVCIINYEPQSTDTINSRALVTVKEFTVNYTAPGNEHYWFALDTGDVKEIRLTGYSGDLDICWSSTEETDQSSGIYYAIYDDVEVTSKMILAPFTTNGTFVVSGNFVNASSGRLEYTSCETVDISVGSVAMRLKSMYAPSKVAVFPQAGGFPVQGFQITSLGEIDNIVDKVKETKKITVFRSLPYVPSVFDYGVYTKTALE